MGKVYCLRSIDREHQCNQMAIVDKARSYVGHSYYILIILERCNPWPRVSTGVQTLRTRLLFPGFRQTLRTNGTSAGWVSAMGVM